MSPSSSIEKVSGWGSLSPQDKEAVSALLTDKSKHIEGSKILSIHNSSTICQITVILLFFSPPCYYCLIIMSYNSSDQATSQGAKRKTAGTNNQKPKVLKIDLNNSSDRGPSKGNKAPDYDNSDTMELDKRLEVQSKLLWDIKDELKKKVSVAELREMLKANEQDSTGSEHDLRDCWLVFIIFCNCLEVFLDTVLLDSLSLKMRSKFSHNYVFIVCLRYITN